MRSVGEEEGKDAHVKPTFVQEVHVANGRRPYSSRRPCSYSIEDSSNEDSSPCGAVSCRDICDSSHKIADNVNRPSPVQIRQWNCEKGSYARKHDVNRKLIGGLDDSDVKLLAERDESWIDDCAGHGTEERQPTDLQKDEQLEQWRPVLCLISR
jgi:hypothetical protein